MTTVLVATDLGGNGDRAMERGALICREMKADLVALHVLSGNTPSDLRMDFAGLVSPRLKRQAEGLRTRFGIEVSSTVEFGKDWMVILEQAEALGADLVVLGAHSHPGVLDLFRGTTVEKVARHCDTALLVVSVDPEERYGSVLVATDFSLAAREALELALLVAPAAAIRLMHCFTISLKGFLRGRERREILDTERRRQREEAERAMATFLGGLDLKAGSKNPVIVEGVPPAAIRAEVQQEKTELLVLGTHSRPKISEALLGSVARDLMSDPPCDILVVPPPFRNF